MFYIEGVVDCTFLLLTVLFTKFHCWIQAVHCHLKGVICLKALALLRGVGQEKKTVCMKYDKYCKHMNDK